MREAAGASWEPDEFLDSAGRDACQSDNFLLSRDALLRAAFAFRILSSRLLSKRDRRRASRNVPSLAMFFPSVRRAPSILPPRTITSVTQSTS